MVKNSINASYDDDFDDPFAPSDDSNINVPAHDDWNGLPWTEEPYDYDNPFDHNKDYTLMIQLVTILTMICLFLMIIRLHLMITTAEIATRCPVQKQKKRNVQSLLLK